MAVFTVHEPPLKRYETEPEPERFAFVRDGFSFWAFVLGPLLDIAPDTALPGHGRVADLVRRDPILTDLGGVTPRPDLDLASTLGFARAMDGSGKRLDSSGHRGGVRRAVAEVIRTPSGLLTGSSAAIGAEVIGSHYVARRWALNSKASRSFIHLLCLHCGAAAEIRHEGETIALSGPAIVWLPRECAEYLEVSAGAAADLLQLRSGAWHRYLPPSAESAYLALEGTGSILTLTVEPDLVTSVSRSIAAITAEIATPARTGAASIMSSELTLCVLRFWRLLAGDSEPGEDGGSAEILGRFRRLLEERYHQQLRVAD